MIIRVTARRAVLSGAAAMVFTLLVDACSNLTDVRAPDVVQPSALDNRAGADTRRAGAITSFATAFALRVAITSWLTDEQVSTLANGEQTDQRVIREGDAIYPYTSLQQARINAREAIRTLQAYRPAPTSNIGHMYALAGYTEVFFAEDVCSGVPLGSIENGDPVFADPSTTMQLYVRAIADFDTAIVNATDSAPILNLARVGRGRALLGLGRFTDAASAVAQVPTSFVFVTEHSATVQPNVLGNPDNPVASAIQTTIADREGGNGLDYRSASDPRVTTRFVGKGPDGVTDIYLATKYPNRAAPIVLASGTEARLIEAEALLASGDAAGALAKLNELRSTMPGLAPLALQPRDAGRVDQLYRERAFWTFLTGHRLGDMRRLVRLYRRSPESVFPTGPYKSGQVYGSAVTFTPNRTEINNPNYHGCLNRDA